MTWPIRRLDEVCLVTMGQAPDGGAYNENRNGWPLIAGAGDFGELYPAAKKYTTQATRLCKQDDIIIGIRASIGEKVLADAEYCLGRGVAGLRARDGLEPRYLWHWLSVASPILASKGRGATFKQVKKDDVAELHIPLPPLPEQHRIAVILDQADALRAKRYKSLALLDSLAQSIFIELFGDPIENPKNWSTELLGNVAVKITDGTHKTPVYTENGVEFLSAKDLKQGKVVWGTGKYISSKEHNQLIRRCHPEKGDVLLGKSGSLGEVALVDREHSFSLFESLCLIKPDRRKIDEHFLYGLLRTRSMKRKLLESNKGVAIRHLHLVDVRSLSVPVPPLRIQHQFMEAIHRIELQRKVVVDTNAALHTLFVSLQHRAFRGEL